MAKKMKKGKGPCWDGYEMIGMKSKGGRKVPNCVPKKSKGGEMEYKGSLINSEIDGVTYSNKSYEDYYKDII
jgi:hypothetical protein